MSDLVSNLLEVCNAARWAGADFPRIWRDILQHHPLVTGDPVQGIGEAGPHLEIPLFAGQVMLFGAEGFAIK
jgi:hypothetical protein